MKARTWLVVTGLLASLVSACGDSSTDETTPVAGAGFRITASGEELALTGYDFPAAAGQEVVIVDGWEIRFEKVLVAVHHVTLAATPDLAPTDQSQTGGVVAELEGPWVLDLNKAGDGTVAGKESGVRAWVLGDVKQQANGAPFSTSERYAVSYEVGPVSAAEAAGAKYLGTTASDVDTQELVAKGYTHLVVGTATRKAKVAECRVSDTAGFDTATLPSVVRFRWGIAAPVTPKNCQNPDLAGTALDGEDAPRGVQARAGEPVDVQLTFHLDHLFWPSVDESSSPIFNHLAAQAKKQPDGTFLLTMEDLEGVGVAPVSAGGKALPWTSCVPEADYTLPTTPKQLTLDTEGNADLAHVADLLMFNARTMAHLNQDGICFVDGAAHSHDHDHE